MSDSDAVSEDSPPAGCHWEWIPADDGWTTVPEGLGRCRFTVALRTYCNAPSVAALRRGRAAHGQWWHYCEDHLYGRRIHDGAVERRVTIEGEQ